RLRADAMLRAKESCSDIVQSVCREMLEQLDSFEYQGEAQFRAWLFKRAMSKIIDRVRYLTREKRDVRREVPMETSTNSRSRYGFTNTTPTQIAIGNETMEQLEAAFDKLSAEQREVFLLAKLIGLPRKEIAASMGKTELAVRALLHRALVKVGGILTLQVG
ncbi:MAG: sigma-70 family RNA polymerase sigma factor, partial [Planctomycetota bacterium]